MWDVSRKSNHENKTKVVSELDNIIRYIIEQTSCLTEEIKAIKERINTLEQSVNRNDGYM